MYIYLISQTANTGYDTYDSAVVCAENADEARKIHPSKYYSLDNTEDWSLDWSLPQYVKVKLLGTAEKTMERGIVCASFNAG